MKKKILRIFLIGILIMGITGCGKEDSQEKTKQSNTSKDTNC